MKINVVFYIVWNIICFIIAILQSYMANLIKIENGKIVLKYLLQNKLFWFLLFAWIVGNLIIFLCNNKNENKSKTPTININQSINRGDGNNQMGIQNNYKKED